MTISVAQFRIDYPEFASTANYPDSMVTYWLDLAYVLLNAWRFATVLDSAAELYTAHNCVLEFQAARGSARGGAPGAQKGAVSAESAGPASQSYDTAAAAEEGYANFNLTTYGTRLAGMIRMFGAGPVQL